MQFQSYTFRVLSRIYRLGEKSRVGEGHELPRGVRGHAPPEMFWNEYALRCNLVHFETQFWEMLQWYFILFFSRDHVLTMLHLAPIFFGGKLGIFFWGGGSFYPSNTLDRTLTLYLYFKYTEHDTYQYSYNTKTRFWWLKHSRSFFQRLLHESLICFGIWFYQIIEHFPHAVRLI